MNEDLIKKAVKSCILFSELDEDHVSLICDNAKTLIFDSGCDITEHARSSLIVIASGSANVFSKENESNTLLRILSTGDVFGIAGLVGGYTKISRIVVKSGRLYALSIPREIILSIISADNRFAQKYIAVLEKKIVFLNRRIASFTAGTCEKRLATFLCSVSGEEQFEAGPIAFSSLAKQLNMGRASFYRALDTLERDGVIRRGSKTIQVISRSLLKEKHL